MQEGTWTLEVVAIILGIVSLIITVIGLLASVFFYISGMKTQYQAREALTKIEERLSSVQHQVSGVVGKTLDHVLGRAGIGSSQPQLPVTPPRPDDAGEADEPEENALPYEDIQSYLALQGRVFADVRQENLNATMFGLGSPASFNLALGSDNAYIYLGLFSGRPARDVVLRLRALLQSLARAHSIIENTNDAQPIAAWRAMNLSVELFVADDLEVQDVQQKIARLRESIYDVPVTMLHTHQIRRALENTYDAI